ncbi:OmcA/MtrC family decaheme c-type cytochrome [Shewanella goraebulensis]|uniref:OmcA/MtrC family decaheme c-type cytochrome n=1 Tax=Shewanella goraebulensis TaxID=3050637 RepID=UPI00255025C6|nr:OmcA/MtrC family decaheme c-type cytochrome [Shewanella goraebulensis]
MKNYKKSILAAALMTAVGLTGCSDGEDGQDGQDGAPGQDGEPGTSIGNVVDTVDAATDFVLTVSPEDIVVVGSEDFAVKFTATGKNAKGEELPFTGLDQVAFYVMNQAANDTDTGAPILWESNGLANDFSYSMYCTLTGTADSWGTEVDACTLVEDEANPGTYTGTWEHDGNAPIVLENGDANSLHRVMVRTYNVVDSSGTAISDKLLSTPIDFIPATGEIAISEKDSVSNAACIKCHGQLDGYDDADARIGNIDAHHNYQKVENCVACHNPAYAGGEDDPTVGWNANWNAMIHTLHAGHHLDLEGEAEEMFGEIGFPAELNECTTCHDSGTQWNDNVYAEACVSCHTDVDFETGDGHLGIVPESDAACSGCHGAGSLSPLEAHGVGDRAVLSDKFIIDIQSAVVEDSEVDGMSTLVVTSEVSMNGELLDATTYAAMADYMTNSGRGLLIGTLNADTGALTHGYGADGGFKMDFVGGVMSADGIVVNEAEFATDLLVGPIYATAEVQLCGADGEIVTCTTDDDGNIEETGVANQAETKYFNLTDGDAAVEMRLADADRTSISEAKCNACHGNLTHVKSTHGVTEFTQCAYCHSENLGGSPSYHPTAVYKTDEVDADGNAIWGTVEGLSFANRDLVTVSHRFHAGYFDGTPAIYRDADGELNGYSAPLNNCNSCHKDDSTLFAADGGLTSGKRSVETDAGFISPISEACRSCHVSASALAHFKSNGAYVQDEPGSVVDLPVESCSTCHAEGKTYGVDVMHSGTSH